MLASKCSRSVGVARVTCAKLLCVASLRTRKMGYTSQSESNVSFSRPSLLWVNSKRKWIVLKKTARDLKHDSVLLRKSDFYASARSDSGIRWPRRRAPGVYRPRWGKSRLQLPKSGGRDRSMCSTYIFMWKEPQWEAIVCWCLRDRLRSFYFEVFSFKVEHASKHRIVT